MRWLWPHPNRMMSEASPEQLVAGRDVPGARGDWGKLVGKICSLIMPASVYA